MDLVSSFVSFCFVRGTLIYAYLAYGFRLLLLDLIITSSKYSLQWGQARNRPAKFKRKSISRKITHPQYWKDFWKRDFRTEDFTWNWFPTENLPIDVLLTTIVESIYFNIDMCNSNHRKKMKAKHSRLIPPKHTENLELLIVWSQLVSKFCWCLVKYFCTLGLSLL